MAAEVIQEFSTRDAVLSFIDDAFQAGTRPGFESLRQLNTEAVGRLLLGVPGQYHHAAASLPAMAEDHVQISWTGSAGDALLAQSVAFIDAIVAEYRKRVGHPLSEAAVLDYGCGWGRLIRLMYAHAKPENLYGCDPWDESIRLCREARIKAHLAISDYVPSALPFETPFHLIYAYSVFTHLSQKTADAVMSTLRKHVAPDGLLVITIRPESYWTLDPLASDRAEELMQRHREEGFAFVPHIREPIDGDVTYGDTSMSVEYVEKRWPEWRVVAVDPFCDQYQRLVYLAPS